MNEGRWSARPFGAAVARVSAGALPLFGMLVAFALATSGRRLAGAVLGIVLVAASWLVGRGLLAWSTLLRVGMRFPTRAPSRPLVAIESAFSDRLEARLGCPPSESPAEAARRLLTAGLVADRTRWGGQAMRAGRLADTLAAHLHWSPTDRSGIWWAALAGNLGSIFPPADADQDSQLRGSLELLRPLALWLGEWQRAVADQQELWSGAGEPAGLSGEAIHRGARLLAVAAAYDQLTARAGGAMSDQRARADLGRTAAWQFDPSWSKSSTCFPRAPCARPAATWWASGARWRRWQPAWC